MSWITWAITNILPLVLAAWLKSGNERREAAQTRSDQIDLGQSRAAAATNRETADAERRASEAMVKTGDLDDLLAGMAEGKF